MPRTACPTPEQLDAYVLGRLSEPELEGVERHLAACAVCEASVQKLDSFDQLFNAAFRRDAGGGKSLVNEPESPRAEAAQLAGSLADQPRELMGEYRILERLGSGGMATVYKAIHTRLKRTVAVKMLPAERCQDPAWTSRFDREMAAIAALDDPHIVRVFDGREIEGRRILVMEFVEGLDLGQACRRMGPLRMADACEIICQAADGLQAAHQHGMVHRDIKPSNLMLSVRGEVKVLDLGLARFQGAAVDDELTETDQTLGTVDYIAPEQIVDSRRVDIRADLYSLGCTLYKLLTGHSPYNHIPTMYQRMAAHLHAQPRALNKFRGDVPDGLAAVVAKMMAKPVAERYATTREVREALAPFCEGNSLVALVQKALATPGSRDSKGPLPPTAVNESATPASCGAAERTLAQSSGQPPAPAPEAGPRSPLPPEVSPPQVSAGQPPNAAGPTPPEHAAAVPPAPPPAAPPQAGPPPCGKRLAWTASLALAAVLLALIAWHAIAHGNESVKGRIVGIDPAGATIVILPASGPATQGQQVSGQGGKPAVPLVFRIGKATRIEDAGSPAQQVEVQESQKAAALRVGEMVEVTYSPSSIAATQSQGQTPQTSVQGQQQQVSSAPGRAAYEAVLIRILSASAVNGEDTPGG